jgi:small subunit ribosomal protein S1
MTENTKAMNAEELEMFDEEEMDEEFGEESFRELFENSPQGNLAVGDVVEGTVIQVNPDSVVVDVGYKSEGVIPLSEFSVDGQPADIKVNDKIDVLFERAENDSGLIGLSKEKADRQKVWNSLEEDAVVEGKIVSRI